MTSVDPSEPLQRVLALANDKACYAVVGNPVNHSRSPQIHQAFADQFQKTLYYGKACLNEATFLQSVQQFFEQGGKGLNVTVPFKSLAYEGCSVLTDRARCAGAVNTLWWRSSQLCGDNTDGVGLVRDIEQRCQLPLSGQSILILGAGGATRGVIQPLFEAGASSITLANRTRSRAENLAKLFGEYGSMSVLEPGEVSRDCFSVVIHATGAGLSNTVPALSPSWFDQTTLAYDMFYSKEQTPFLKAVQDMGVRHLYDGIGMLVEQAAASFERWTGKMPTTTSVIEALQAQP